MPPKSENSHLTATAAKKRLRDCATDEVAKNQASFFKLGPGEYGEGDVFIGVRVPVLRKIARDFRDLSTAETLKLLHSPIHEERVLALIVWVENFKSGSATARKKLFDLYLANAQFVNNWDLVDLSAPQIVGVHLYGKSRKLLAQLARSKNLWERRIAIVATLSMIRQNDFAPTLQIAKQLLHDREDLIHKAVGWMLREVGKKDQAVLETFLDQHVTEMPRTTLRYAIERYPEKQRKAYLAR